MKSRTQGPIKSSHRSSIHHFSSLLIYHFRKVLLQDVKASSYQEVVNRLHERICDVNALLSLKNFGKTDTLFCIIYELFPRKLAFSEKNHSSFRANFAWPQFSNLRSLINLMKDFRPCISRRLNKTNPTKGAHISHFYSTKFWVFAIALTKIPWHLKNCV